MSDLNAMFGLNGMAKADYSGAKSAGNDMTASREWASRPQDERYTSMESLDEHVSDVRANSKEITVDLSVIRSHEVEGRLMLEIPGHPDLVEPTHHGFSQLCTRIDTPAAYMRKLPTDLATQCLNHGFDNGGDGGIALITKDKLRAFTSETYGRIWDAQFSNAVRMLAEETNAWQVPIAFHTPGQTYNPIVAMDVSKAATTLYSGDRDMFLFLADQTRPIEAGKLSDGSPRLFFRGFMVWNSEVGARKYGIKTFLYEMVCANRIIWNQAGVEEFSARHTRLAPAAFVQKLVPALKAFMEGSATGVEQGLIRAQQTIIAQTDDQRSLYLDRVAKVPLRLHGRIMDAVLAEEGHEMQTVFDVIQGITAVARDRANQDDRLELEQLTTNLLDRVTA